MYVLSTIPTTIQAVSLQPWDVFRQIVPHAISSKWRTHIGEFMRTIDGELSKSALRGNLEFICNCKPWKMVHI